MSNLTVCEDGSTFNEATAEQFEEDTYWDGHNHVSKATGSQWDHEVLHHTQKGAWVLQQWSQWEGSRETFHQVSADEARKWLLRNGEHEAAAAHFDLEDTSI